MNIELLNYLKGIGIGFALGAAWSLLLPYPAIFMAIGTLLFVAMIILEVVQAH